MDLKLSHNSKNRPIRGKQMRSVSKPSPSRQRPSPKNKSSFPAFIFFSDEGAREREKAAACTARAAKRLGRVSVRPLGETRGDGWKLPATPRRKRLKPGRETRADWIITQHLAGPSRAPAEHLASAAESDAG